MTRPARGRRTTIAVATVTALVASLLAVVAGRPASAVELPAGVASWDAAPNLPPMEGGGGDTAPLDSSEIRPLSCADDVCLSTTVRPQLEATIDPDPDKGYSFVVFDLAGAGGLTDAAASVVGHDQATWAPQAGLLQHGHVYAWMVEGDEDETQDWGVFIVDLQRQIDQGVDAFGPISTAISTGELVIDHPLGSPEDDYPLAVRYRSSDPTGRSAGATPLNVLSDGWTLSGSAIGDASWYEIEIFADGATIVAHAVDGTSLRYDRDEDGKYLAPHIDGVDVSFMYPTVDVGTDGSVVISETDGSISTFTSSGTLSSFERPAREGGAALSLDVVWEAGLLRAVTDRMTGRTSTFTYLGDRECRVGGGFDNGSQHPALCSVTTLAGETIELRYLDRNLSRIIGAGGAVTDIAYDDSGVPTAVRESLAADTIAADLIADDAAATWRIEFDGEGRVAQVTSPQPQPGEEPLSRTYSYDDGVTSIADNGGQRGAVTFDPIDYRVLRLDAAESSGSFTPLYDDDNRTRGYVDERGLQTSWVTDDAGNVTDVWGPAPEGWFDAAGRPLPAHADEIATSTTTYGAGSGMLAVFGDGTDVSGRQTAQTLLTAATIEELPSAVDSTDGWRLNAIGDIELPLDGDVDWRFTASDDADPDATQLLVNNVSIAPGDETTIATPEDADAAVPVEFWLVYASTETPTAGSPAWFRIEYRTEGDEQWTTVDPSSMIGEDLPTSRTSLDVYAAGHGATATTTSMAYTNPLLGLVGEYTTAGQSSTVDYESANPLADQFARPLAVTNPAGVTSAITYWGAQETATHPITGESLPQSGRIREVTTGTDVARGMVYDAPGRVVAYTANGTVTSAVVYDQRARVTTVELRDQPSRSTTYHHGAGGDPRVTGATLTIGDETLTSITTVDLLGRVVTDTDTFGTTATTTYDDVGSITNVSMSTADGATSTTTYSYDPGDRQLRQVVVDAADGNSYSATITGYDQAARITSVTYSNGTELSIEYDPANGMVSAHHWIDGNDGTWSDAVERTGQTGRILGHTLAHPTGSATFEYGYDPATGALTNAALAGTGDGPAPTNWSYEYAAGARVQKVTTTDDGTVTLDYTYDANQAPTRVEETIDPSDADVVTREIPVTFQGADIVGFDSTALAYDVEGLLVRASDDDTSIELTRDASGTVLSQTITTPTATTVHAYSGPFVLDRDRTSHTESIALPGGVTVLVPLVDGDTSWTVTTLAGDVWWTAGSDGAPMGVPVHYSPDGEQLGGETDATFAGESAADPTRVDATLGWRAGHAGLTLSLDTPVTVFGARAYIPALGMFTTTDPIPGAGPTPYSYADNDPINLVDPTGNSSEGPFDDWNSWGTQLVITIGLTALAITLALLGQPGAAAAVMVVLAGYLGALSVDAYMNGDYVGGTLYAISAILVLAGGVKIGHKAAVTRSTLLHRSSVSQSHHAAVRTPTLSSSNSASSQSTYLSNGAYNHQVRMQQQQLVYNNLVMGFGGVGSAGAGAGASVGWSFAAKAVLYGIATGFVYSFAFLVGNHNAERF